MVHQEQGMLERLMADRDSVSRFLSSLNLSRARLIGFSY